MRTGIALGSNLGDRLQNLHDAYLGLMLIANPREPILCGSIYESEPVDCPSASPPFLNTAIEIDYAGPLEKLLEITQKIECDLGRTNNPVRNAPRSIDVDLLYCDEICLTNAHLTIPHPRMLERRFVMQPLADICPERILPHCQQSIKNLLDQLDPNIPSLRLIAKGFNEWQSPAL